MNKLVQIWKKLNSGTPVQVLADLNDCTVGELIDALVLAGYEVGMIRAQRYQQLYDQGLNDYEIAEEIGDITFNDVEMWRSRNDLPRIGLHPKMYWQYEAQKLYNEGLNDTEISARVGKTIRSVQNWRHKNELPPNDPRGRKRKYEH